MSLPGSFQPRPVNTNPLTTPAEKLLDRLVPWQPIAIQRFDGSRYIAADWDEIKALIEAGCVEGKETKSGRIRYLRVICDEQTAIARMAEALRKVAVESAGSITSGASKTSFQQHLESGHTCWTLKNMQDGWNRQSLSAFVGNPLRFKAESLVTA